jgi:hypothetical protein
VEESAFAIAVAVVLASALALFFAFALAFVRHCTCLFVCHSAAKRRNLLFAHVAAAFYCRPKPERTGVYEASSGAKRSGGICCLHG